MRLRTALAKLDEHPNLSVLVFVVTIIVGWQLGILIMLGIWNATQCGQADWNPILPMIDYEYYYDHCVPPLEGL